MQTPVYAFLFNLAQATVGERRAGANPSARIWQMLGGGETRSARFEAGCLGQSRSLALLESRTGWGSARCGPTSPRGRSRAGFEAMAEVVERLGIAAEHVIFGHTHRRGAPDGQTATASGMPAAGSTRRACSARPRR